MSTPWELFSAPTPLYRFLVLNEGTTLDDLNAMLQAKPEMIQRAEPVEEHKHDETCIRCETCKGSCLFKTYFVTSDRKTILEPGYVTQCETCNGLGCRQRKRRKKK